MKTEEIFSALCNFRDSQNNGGISPAQLKQEGVKSTDVDDNGQDVISHVKYEGEDGGTVEEVITSYDHSRTFDLRPDTNHFSITQFDSTGKEVKSASYMQMDNI